MQSNQLQRVHPNTKRMIVARGGKRGKTSGRGGKGQSARAGNKRRPEWRDIIKQLPKLRGRGVNQNKSIQDKPAIVNIGLLEEMFSAGDSITPTILVEKLLVSTRSGKIPRVKILGDGEMTKKFIITGCLVSASAQEKIEKAGGSVVGTTKDEAIKAKKISDSAKIVQSNKAKSENANTKKAEAPKVKKPAVTKEVKKDAVAKEAKKEPVKTPKEK
jgi:large subunit ribosomal protein L15